MVEAKMISIAQGGTVTSVFIFFVSVHSRPVQIPPLLTGTNTRSLVNSLLTPQDVWGYHVRSALPIHHGRARVC